MSKSPIQKAIEATPGWFYSIPGYDGLEIHPVREAFFEDRSSYCKPCTPDEAQFWSVYGHLKSGGVDCIEDFASEEDARAFARQLLECYPHLRHHSLLG